MRPDEIHLVRAISCRALTASIINTTVGAGIFVLPATVAARLGAAAPLAYVACAGLMALIVLCFAAAGSRVSLTGGLYAYIEVAFGTFVGFLAGVLYWLTGVLTVVAFFTVLFTRRIPREVFELMVPGMRWNLRGNAYAYFMTDRYPPFIWG